MKNYNDYWWLDGIGTVFAGICIGAAFVLFLFL